MTIITSDQRSLTTFVASFVDGTVKVFDRRLDEENVVVQFYGEHQSWVQNVRWHPQETAKRGREREKGLTTSPWSTMGRLHAPTPSG